VQRPTLKRERALWAQGVQLVAGLDEVGRGPLAGPVVAAAVVFPPGEQRLRIKGMRDSKLMTAAQREVAAVLIRRRAVAWSVAAASVREIDRYNIRRASALAMRRALERLGVRPDHVLVDGTPLPELGTDHEALVGGDRECASIAAASILAKCVRDRLMVRLARRYPVFHWEANKGYATREHLDVLDFQGPTPHHRKSFTPVVQLRVL
jgi:ribonuclease HII